jgi:hypothetical protein
MTRFTRTTMIVAALSISAVQLPVHAAAVLTLAAQQPTSDNTRDRTISPLASKQRTGDGGTAGHEQAAMTFRKQPSGDGDTGYGDRASRFGSDAKDSAPTRQ